MMDVRPLHTESDYDWALAEIERYFDHEPVRGTPEADRFEVLASLIDTYEAKNWPIEAPDPVAAISGMMEMRGLNQSDLAKVLGSRSRASEVMRRKRALTVDMIYKINTTWRIPADVLVRPYHLEEREPARK